LYKLLSTALLVDANFPSHTLQDIPNIIAAAREQRSERLGVQASMRDTANPDTHVVLYLQVS
jgi:hypothetical protein